MAASSVYTYSLDCLAETGEAEQKLAEANSVGPQRAIGSQLSQGGSKERAGCTKCLPAVEAICRDLFSVRMLHAAFRGWLFEFPSPSSFKTGQAECATVGMTARMHTHHNATRGLDSLPNWNT